jgi:tetratricopeptide (TPR) repeat protein
MGEPASDIPAAPDIRAQVERMIASSDFSRSPQLGAFLQFVVESVLNGQSGRIKAYTIGVEVLRRDAKFDPQLDPIVRVEATRLRRTIDRYYAGEGSDDPIRISLPRGSYVPTFSRRQRASGATARLLALPFVSPLRPIPLLLSGVAAMVAIAAVVAVLYRPSTPPAVATSEPAKVFKERSTADALPLGDGLPDLVVPPFDVTGTAGPRSVPAGLLHDTLTGAFSHFDLVDVRLEPRTGPPAAAGSAPARDARPDYRFAGSVQYVDDGAAQFLFRLIDVTDGSVVWSRAFDNVPASDDQSSAEDKIVRELAGTLLQPFGVIYAHERAKVVAGQPIDPRYHCLVDVIDTFSTFDLVQQSRARNCLEELVARDPGFALGFTYLAAVDLREYEYGFDVRPGDPPPLESGLIAARRGVELNPASSRAYEMLFVILFARGDLTAAFDAANKAIALNTYDMRLLGAYGARLIASGNIDRGLAVLRQAGDDGTVRPPFEEFFLFLGAYLRNDTADAAFHAGQLSGNTFQLGLIARALDAAGKGDLDAARRPLVRLVALNPAWRDDLRGCLRRFFMSPVVVERLVNDLTAAGLTADFRIDPVPQRADPPTGSIKP